MVLRRAAFDEVAGQGEGSADEADEGLVVAEFVEDDRDAVGDFVDFVVEDGQVVDVGAGAHRLVHDRPAAGDDFDADAGGLEGHDDVGEEDGGVDVVATDGLEGDFGQQLRHEAGVEHGDAFAGLFVFGQGAACLAHEPDGGPGGGAAGGGVKDGGTV